MPQFSPLSLQRLAECDPRLQQLFKEVIKHFDCMVTCGHRNQSDQHAAFIAGKSKLDWPEGNHNASPSLAVDVWPYPYDEKDLARIRYFAGFVMGTAVQLGLEVRWGGDWDQDTQVNDQTFNDLVHFEVKPQTSETHSGQGELHV